MASNSLYLKQIFSVVRQRRWLMAGLTVLGALLGSGWRLLHPLPAQYRIELPIVIRNRQENPMWSDDRVDALYHSIFQIIDTARPGVPALSQNAWLALTEETFELTVRHPDARTAAELTLQWAQAAYHALAELASEPIVSSQASLLAECVGDEAENVGFSCSLADADVEIQPAASQNTAFISLWIGEPENLSYQNSSLMFEFAAAFLGGAIMGMLIFLALVFLQISSTGFRRGD